MKRKYSIFNVMLTKYLNWLAALLMGVKLPYFFTKK